MLFFLFKISINNFFITITDKNFNVLKKYSKGMIKNTKFKNKATAIYMFKAVLQRFFSLIKDICKNKKLFIILKIKKNDYRLKKGIWPAFQKADWIKIHSIIYKNYRVFNSVRLRKLGSKRKNPVY